MLKISARYAVFVTLNNAIKIFFEESDEGTSYDLWLAPESDEWYGDSSDDGGIIVEKLFNEDGTFSFKKKVMDFVLMGTGISFDEQLIQSYVVDDDAVDAREAIGEEPFNCDNAFDYVVAQLQSELDYDKKPYSKDYCLGEQIFRIHAEDGEVTVRIQVSARNKPLQTNILTAHSS